MTPPTLQPCDPHPSYPSYSTLTNADVHAGNLLMLEDGRVAFIGFGIVGAIPRTTADALPALRRPEVLKMFAKYGVLSRDEMKLRVEVLLETYGTQLGIEARTMVSIGRREILPASLRHQADLAETAAATAAAGLADGAAAAELVEFAAGVDAFRASLKDLDAAEAKSLADAAKYAAYCRDVLIPAMEAVRTTADNLEATMPTELWPMPSYATMLFER